MAHQYIDQWSDEVQHAVFGNVGNIVAFRVSAGDAERLSREIPDYPPTAFRELGRGGVCVRLLEHGEVMQAHLGKTELPDTPLHNRSKDIIERCRRRDGRSRSDVEARIAAWFR